MKNRIVHLIIGALVILGMCQSVDAEGIYVVDMQRVVGESISGRAAKTNLEADMKKRQASLATKKAELDKLKSELEKQEALLSDSAKSDKRADFAKKVREFERAVADQRDEMSRQNGAEIQKLIEQTRKVLAELAAGHQYELVLENDGRVVLYVNPKLDLTAEVIKLLDAKKVGM